MKNSNFSKTIAVAATLGGSVFTTTAFADDRDMVSETRDLPTFTRIVVKGSADVNVQVGEAQSVEVSTKSDYLARVETEVKDGTLYISQEGRRWNRVDVKLKVSVQSLDGVSVKGSGDFDISNIDSDAFEIIIQGSGDVTASGNSFSYDVTIQGSGDVDLSGECNTMDLDIEGSGDVEARHLKCSEVEVIVDGSGDVDVYASKSLVGSIEGSGDVTIYGDPDRFRPTIKGSGSFSFVDEK